MQRHSGGSHRCLIFSFLISLFVFTGLADAQGKPQTVWYNCKVESDLVVYFSETVQGPDFASNESMAADFLRKVLSLDRVHYPLPEDGNYTASCISSPNQVAMLMGSLDARDATTRRGAAFRTVLDWMPDPEEKEEKKPFDIEDWAPKPVERRIQTGELVSCTNNSVTSPLLEFAFTAPVDEESVPGNVSLAIMESGDWKPAAAEFEAEASTVRIKPGITLEPGRKYRAKLTGGRDGVRGRNPMEFLTDGMEVEFQTAPAADDAAFEEMLADRVDLGLYQVARNAPLVPKKPTFGLTRAPWSLPEGADGEDFVKSFCVDALVETADSGPDLVFPEATGLLYREDVITAAMRRNGDDRVRNQDWAPQVSSSASQRRFGVKLTLSNYTSAGAASAPPDVNHPMEDDVKILAKDAPVTINLFQGYIRPSDALSASPHFYKYRDIVPQKKTHTDFLGFVNDRNGLITNDTMRLLPFSEVSVNVRGGFDVPVSMPDGLFDQFIRVGVLKQPWAADWAEGYINNQALRIIRTQIVPRCTGLDWCAGVMPFSSGGAQALRNEATGSRGFVFYTDAVDAEKPASVRKTAAAKLSTGIAHELGHTVGLAHSPYVETNADYDVLRSYRAAGPIRWPGVDAVSLMTDGKLNMHHTDYGSSQSKELVPLMWPIAPDTWEATMPTDQYLQAIKAVEDPFNRDPKFYNPQRYGAKSSSDYIQKYKVRANRVAFSTLAIASGSSPLVDYRILPGAGRSPTNGVDISLTLTEIEGTVHVASYALLAHTYGVAASKMPDAPSNANLLTVAIADAGGSEIASREIAILPFTPAGEAYGFAEVSLFLPAADQNAIGAVTVTNEAGDVLLSQSIASMEGRPAPRSEIQAGGAIQLGGDPLKAGEKAEILLDTGNGGTKLIGLSMESEDYVLSPDLLGDADMSDVVVRFSNGLSSVSHRLESGAAPAHPSKPAPGSVDCRADIDAIIAAQTAPLKPNMQKQMTAILKAQYEDVSEEELCEIRANVLGR